MGLRMGLLLALFFDRGFLGVHGLTLYMVHLKTIGCLGHSFIGCFVPLWSVNFILLETISWG